MKILMVTCSMDRGGKERQILALIKGLIGKGFSIELLILSRKVGYKEIYKLPIKIHYANKRIPLDVFVLAKTFRLIKRYRPDIVHAWDSAAVVHSLVPSKMLGVSFVNGMIRSSPTKTTFPTKEWFYKKILMGYQDALVANSRAGLRSYGKADSGQVIYNGYDQNRIAKKDKGNDISGIQLEDRVVAMISAFTTKKDYDTFLKAATVILSEYANVTFLAIGDGPLLHKYRSEYENNKILFLGERSDVDKIIPYVDIGILTCVSSWRGEGVPNALMEFMANAKPVIGTNSGGTCELIQNGINGYIIEESDVNALIKAVKRILSNSTETTIVANAAADTIRERFSLQIMVGKYVKLYQKLSKNS